MLFPDSVSSSASSAFSIPDAFSVAALRLEGVVRSLSSCERSRPRDFFCAVLAPAPLALEGWEASSSASRASRSAFLRAASAFLASADSLFKQGG